MSISFEEEVPRPAKIHDEEHNVSSSTNDIPFVLKNKVEPNTEPNSDAESLVDGGRMGWICVVGSWFALFSTFGLLNTMGLFQTYYQETLLSDYSASAISWIFTIQLFLMWTGGAFFGRVIDNYGTHHVAVPCSIACVVFIILLSLCTTYMQIFLAQGVGFGLAASGLFSCGIVSVGQWFHKRKALALGLVLMGSSTGGVVHPLYLQILIREIGWPAAVRCCALIIAVASTLACLLMRGRLPKKKWDRSRLFFDFALFKTPVFSVYSVGTFFVVWGLFSTWNYLPSMTLRHGFSRDRSIDALVILNAASIFGRTVPAHFADIFGRFNMICVIAFLNALILLGFWLPLDLSSQTTHAQIFVFSGFAGFATGACISVFMPCVAELGPVESLGQRFGMYQAVIGFASLASLPIQGALIPVDYGEFAYLILFSGISILLGSVIICGARMLRVGLHWRG